MTRQPMFRLDVADCLDVLRAIESESVGAVVTDPPYGIGYQTSWRSNRPERFAKIAGDSAPFVWWIYDAARVLTRGAPLVCFCRWDTAEAFRTAIEWAGLTIRGQVIWDRNAHGLGDLKASPAPQHDTIWIASKGRYRLPGKRPKSIVRHTRIMRDLRHPTEKPLGLMVDLIESYVPPGASILDPFGGSGSTGVAAIKLGHDVHLVEIDPTYAAIARSRCEEALNDGPLDRVDLTPGEPDDPEPEPESDRVDLTPQARPDSAAARARTKALALHRARQARAPEAR